MSRLWKHNRLLPLFRKNYRYEVGDLLQDLRRRGMGGVMDMRKKLLAAKVGHNTSFKSISEYLITHDEYSNLRVQDIVGACSVSASGVIRFCKAMGCSGFPELKYQLSHEAEERVGRAEREKAIRNSSDEHLSSIYKAFDGTHDGLNTELMSKSITALREAEEIIVIGLGSSWIVAKDLELRFQRLKKNCRALNDINLQHFAAKNAGPKTVFWGISYSGTTDSVLNHLRMAQEEGAVTMLMTHQSNRHFESEFDYLMFVYGDEGKDRRTSTICRLTMLYMVDMIYFMYTERYFAEVIQCLEYNS